MAGNQATQFRRNLLNWYEQNHRKLPWRGERDFYKIWVSEVMLQQTQVAKVIDYYHRFLHQFPTIEKLARADTEKILRVWQGLGYYARVRNLHKAAQILVKDFGGELPEKIEDFQKLPGVGSYISAAVYSFFKNSPIPAIDGNAKRVFSRLFEIDTPVDSAAGEKAIYDAVITYFDRTQPGKFNQAIMELGALICKPQQPECRICPLSDFCHAYVNSSQKTFPRKKAKNKVETHRIAIAVVLDNSKFLLARRNPFGLLGGLWEFPGGKINLHENAETACLRHLQEKFGLSATISGRLGAIKHTYSHFKIEGEIFLCQLNSFKPTLHDHDNFAWIFLKESDQLPIHAAHLKIIDMLKSHLQNQPSEQKTW
ncbi:A/G-specific adenine glycosylase [candidate division KSB1 bacterium 4484_87]|nr:MAG: A/G-specific adenine glycosylase [candidate division KSB1 bacterium 4484_87]